MYTKDSNLREPDVANLRQDTGIDSLSLNESFLEMIERGVVEELLKDKQEYRTRYAGALRKNGSLNQRDRTKLLALQAEKGLGDAIIQTITAEEDQAFEHDQHLYQQACADYFHQTAASVDEVNQYLQPQAKSFHFGRAVVNAILEQEQEYFEGNRQSYSAQAKEQLFGYGKFNQALLTKQQAELKLGDRVVQSIEDEVSHAFQDIRHAYADLYKADLYDDEAVERAHLRDHQREFQLGDEVVIQVHQDIQDEFQRDRQTYYDADFADLHDDGQRDAENLKVLQRQLGLGDVVIQSVQVNVDHQFHEHWSDYKNAYQMDLYEDGHCNEESLRDRQLKLHLGYEVIKAIAQTVAEDFDSDRQRYAQQAADQLHSSGIFNEEDLSSLQRDLGLGETVCQDLEDKANTAFNEDCETFKAAVFEHLHQWGEVQDHQLLELQLGLGKAVRDGIVQEEGDRFQSEIAILAEVIAEQLHQHDTWQSDQLTQLQAEFQLSDRVVEHIVAEQQNSYHSHRRTYRLVYSQATREITGSTLGGDATVRLAQLRDELGLSDEVGHGIKQAYHHAQQQYQDTFDSVLRRYDCSNSQPLSIDASDRSSLSELQTSLDLEAEDIQIIERDAEQDYRRALDDYEEEVRSLLHDNAELVDSDTATLTQLQQELYIQPNVADCIKSRVLNDMGLQVELPVVSPVISEDDVSQEASPTLNQEQTLDVTNDLSLPDQQTESEPVEVFTPVAIVAPIRPKRSPKTMLWVALATGAIGALGIALFGANKLPHLIEGTLGRITTEVTLGTMTEGMGEVSINLGNTVYHAFLLERIGEEDRQIIDDAEKLAEEKKWVEAINKLEEIPKESNAYAAVENLKREWYPQILEDAQAERDKGNLEQAIALAELIEPEHNLRELAQDSVYMWRAENTSLTLLREANARGDREAVRSAAQDLRNRQVPYWDSVVFPISGALEPDSRYNDFPSAGDPNDYIPPRSSGSSGSSSSSGSATIESEREAAAREAAEAAEREAAAAREAAAREAAAREAAEREAAAAREAAAREAAEREAFCSGLRAHQRSEHSQCR
ncbi:hypothetical protein [Leptolyngbya sp. CCY15150]|uniref:hypothetical protein n=1 Tax=Leptolyngbya sp. CCY15150 TaxID=2767772 RepID=UPI001951E750|nr:hypothetical protein [Leptolyngbya sp. CCY15150]